MDLEASDPVAADAPTEPTPDHRLTFLDQLALELLRATGRGQLMQTVWIYEHPVDLEGLERFRRNLTRTLGTRLVEPSPLPFGRPRWVRPADPPPPILVAEAVRPRDELVRWADGLAGLPIDPVKGPGWRLAVQPFSDGSTAVAITGSHVVVDGVGALMAMFDAINGIERDYGFGPSGARPRLKAVMADLGQTVRDLPLTVRTAARAIPLLRRKRTDAAAAPAVPAPVGSERHITVPSAVVYVDAGQWDRKAEALGGNSYSLLAGFTAKLAEHLGRRRARDGAVTLVIAINTREGFEDDRALAMAFANATVDPAMAAVDLNDTRVAVRHAREKAKSEADPAMEILPIVPWLSRNAVKGVADLMFAYSEDLPVSCSNLGDLPPDVARVDGTPAEYLFIRGLDTNVTLAELERSHGQLVVVSGRINGTVSISLESYQLGADNSYLGLRETAERTLGEFGLTGIVD